MNRQECIEKLMNPNGALLLLAEYRGGKAEIRQYLARNGQRQSMTGAVHRLESGDSALEWSEPLDDKTDVTKWQPPAAKGQRVLVEYELAVSSQRGLYRPRVKRITPIIDK